MTIPAGTLMPRDARAFGSYELVAKIATGGMAEIYLARGPDAAANGLLVVKRILPHLAEDEHFVTMFRDEADLASRLVHPNVCRVFTLGHHDATWFIAMEYLHGVPLSRMMSTLAKRRTFVDFRIIAAIIIQACDGLHHAHEARDDNGALLGVVHRDVSPPNMMLVSDGTVKLLDFGIAKARGANSRTRTGTVKGKNAYMSPEQILGKPLDRRSDVFALGAVMYELLAVKRLFHRESDFMTFKAITEEDVPEIRNRRPDIPPGLRAALLQALAREPSGRFATARGFAEAVRTSVIGLGGPASHEQLAQFLNEQFADELSARDELIEAADAPGPEPVGRSSSTTVPPPLPHPTSGDMIELEAIGGELVSAGDRMPRRASTHAEPIPSMIVANGTEPHFSMQGVSTPSTGMPLTAPMDFSGSLSNIPEANTNILRAYRRRNLRNTFALLALSALVIVVAVLLNRKSPSSSKAAGNLKPVADAQPSVVYDAAPPDADNREDIVAQSKYGLFSVEAEFPTEIIVDKAPIGTTPIKKWPLLPGPHKMEAKGPRGKRQRFDITIYAAQETEHPIILW